MKLDGQIIIDGKEYKLVPKGMLLLDRLDVQLCADAVKRAVAHAALETNRYAPQEMDLMHRLYDALGEETDPADLSSGLAAREKALKDGE